jgi:hypothetical protein
MALPGVKTIIKDRFYSISRQDIPVGPRVVLIAKRGTVSGTGNVQDLDVVQATGEQDVITAFGEDSQIHRGYFELVAGGAERVYIVPLPADSVFNHTTGVITSSTYAAAGGGNVFDAAFESAEAAQPDIIVPWGRGTHSSEWQDPATPGDDEEYGFYANNAASTSSWAGKIAYKVKQISENSHACFAIMGIKAYVGTSQFMTPAQVSSHIYNAGAGPANLISRNSTVDFGTNGDGLFKEIGRHIVVIASELKPVNYPADWGFANGATTFASAISRMSSFTSPVNKTAYNVAALRYNPTRTHQNGLSELGVNFIALNFNKVPTFVEGLTMAAGTSDYTRISTMRIVTEAALLVRQVCTKFVGEASTLQTRNSMETAITSALKGMQQVGALLDSDFTVSYWPAENKAFVDLVITPAFELKNIEVQVAVTI